MTKEHKGVIYILTNPSFPDYVKIGYAHDIEKRLRQLNRSETIPFAFRVYAIYEVKSELTDIELHKLIDNLNPDLRTIETFDGKKRVKEFYAMSREEAYAILESIAKISGTIDCLKRLKPEGHELEDEKLANEVQENTKRGPFRFSQCGIRPGEKVVFIEDNTIQPVVIDDRHIEYNGQTTSLSALAQQLKGFTHPVQGTLWFAYKGAKLTDLREQMEIEKSTTHQSKP
ncbi:MAG: GIY-YIG nuclease family protein [Paludibacteraceae bacterium]